MSSSAPSSTDSAYRLHDCEICPPCLVPGIRNAVPAGSQSYLLSGNWPSMSMSQPGFNEASRCTKDPPSMG